MKTLAITIHIATNVQQFEDLQNLHVFMIDDVQDIADEFARWFGAFHEDQQPKPPPTKRRT